MSRSDTTDGARCGTEAPRPVDFAPQPPIEAYSRAYRLARRRSGLARFERECGCILAPRFPGEKPRKLKAYNVEGTPEYPRYDALIAAFGQTMIAIIEGWGFEHRGGVK